MKTIIIFGLSGSGKSAVADALGQRLNLRIIHPSSILRDLLEQKQPDISNSKAGTGFWESEEGIALFQARLADSYPIDFVCDELLVKELEKGNVVMDSWSIPWIFPRGIKIFLKASKKIRIKRVAKRSMVSIAHARRVVDIKDNETRNLYLHHKGFDIKKDYSVFNMIISVDDASISEIIEHIIKIV